ncbi:MAG: nitroreductase [Rudaea sp.]|uniref:nitroreductase family protein n=1 Tax=Rudaea sp. TaxID=2136325 RepID=UPI0039E2E12B
MSALDFLNGRLSVPSRQLGDPAPSAQQLDRLLAAALRVPDHGKLMPTRLLLIRGATRAKLGEALATIHRRIEPNAPEAVFDKDRERFNFAPLIVCVIARVDAHHPKVPAQEQILSAGCVAYNLLLGAQVLGFGAQWLTGWAAYDRDAAALLGLAADERVIGFVHVGTVRRPAIDGPRPAPEEVVGELTL